MTLRATWEVKDSSLAGSSWLAFLKFARSIESLLPETGAAASPFGCLLWPSYKPRRHTAATWDGMGLYLYGIRGWMIGCTSRMMDGTLLKYPGIKWWAYNLVMNTCAQVARFQIAIYRGLLGFAQNPALIECKDLCLARSRYRPASSTPYSTDARPRISVTFRPTIISPLRSSRHGRQICTEG